MIKEITTLLEKSWGAAMERASKFLGSPAIKEKFAGVEIHIEDLPGREKFLCGSWGLEEEKQTPYIRLFGSSILTGQCDPAKALAKLFIGAALFDHIKDGQWTKDPIWMGLANYGAGLSEEYGIREFNISLPKYDAESFFKDDTRMFFTRQALFGQCFAKVYGKRKLDRLLKSLLAKENYSESVRSATGEESEKVMKKCDECIKEFIEEKTAKAGDYRAVFRAFYKKENEKAISMQDEYLKEHPDTVYMNHLQFFRGATYIRLEKYALALDPLEGVRGGKWGPSYLAINSAATIVFSLLQMGECEKAKERHALFLIYYPDTRYAMMGKFDGLYKEHCAKTASENNGG